MVGNEKEAKCCSTCDIDFNGDKVIGCEGKCGGWFHLKCAHIKEKDFSVISSCRGIKWHCIDCADDPEEKIGIGTIKDLISQALKEYVHEINKLKIIVQDLAIKKTDASALSYAQAVNQAAIIIKPKANQNCNKTRQEIQDKINPSNLAVGVSVMSNMKNGGIIVKCDKKEDTRKLEKEVEKELGVHYDIKRSTLKKPHIKIMGIREKLDKEEIKSCILAQNEATINDKSSIDIKHTIALPNQTIAIAEVDATTFKNIMLEGKINIGWSRCHVVEDVRLWRCFNCAGFNHKASECKNKRACSKCGGDHSYKDCVANQIKCINCYTANTVLKMKFNDNHEAFDENCQVLKRRMEIQRSKIQYVNSECETA